MSWGIKPYDFVQQVFYAQEKVLLDFWPDDDKYKEVLVEANLVLQELQNSEDWDWLRTRIILGDTDQHVPGSIPEYELPQWVYKLSTLHNDCIKLYAKTGCCCHHDDDYNPYDYIDVPIVSTGRANSFSDKQRHLMNPEVSNLQLGAILINDTLTFNRPLTPYEEGRIAVADVQRRLKPIHVCTPACKGVDTSKDINYARDNNGNWKNPCAQIEDVLFTEIPDPNYMVMRTAALHAEGSPPAQGRIAGLTDNAQKILSAMRSNNASATDSDYIEWEPTDFVNVM